MKLEEIIKKLQDMNTVNEGIIDLTDYDKARTQEAEDLKKQLSDANSTITALRDTNQRLYLRVTAEAPQVDDAEEKNDFEKFLEIKRGE